MIQCLYYYHDNQNEWHTMHPTTSSCNPFFLSSIETLITLEQNNSRRKKQEKYKISTKPEVVNQSTKSTLKIHKKKKKIFIEKQSKKYPKGLKRCHFFKTNNVFPLGAAEHSQIDRQAHSHYDIQTQHAKWPFEGKPQDAIEENV